jgi:hypothetical protein
LWPGAGVAAAAVLVAGIAIGKRIEHRAPGAPTVGPAVAATQPTVKARPESATAVAPKTDSLVAALREQTRSTDQRVRELATVGERPSRVRSSAHPLDRAPDDESSALAYRLVVLQHLAGSEAMITAFRASARRGEVDAQLASWSRELLTTTRMLESSRVAGDPTMKRLLDDLDLVIGQIVMYVTRGTNNSEELDLIEQSISSRGVITKLRSTIPARTLSGS